MADIIQLLPDSIANQIAAGEVVQRPASVVKELIENAIDAGADQIKLIIKNSGKTLIQVIDNGNGMSDVDARMAFERHATSKISNAQDLFALTTKGFRGEALASIAAISHVDLITRPPIKEIGIHINIEGSTLKKQEVIQAPVGSSFAVKNLFFNVPARRKFLKSDAVELRHINEELIRVALGHPDIFFTMHHNDNEVYHLSPGNLRQRIIGIFGKSYNDKIVPVGEEMDRIKVSGFIGKPEAAKKSRGDQYLFVNQRYIKSPYLHHAIKSSYEDLMNPEHHPSYFLFLEVDPSMIDVNVHPTKTEIKFEEERLVYNYVKVASKHALGRYNVVPAIDFAVDYNFTQGKVLQERSNSPSGSSNSFSGIQAEQRKGHQKEWQSLYEGLTTQGSDTEMVHSVTSSLEVFPLDQNSSAEKKASYQIHNRYILSQIKSGFLIIDQHAAHERILYEKYLKSLEDNGIPSQKLLFPEKIQLTISQAQNMENIIPMVQKLGFDISPLGGETYVINGIPAGLEQNHNGPELIERIIHQYENNLEFQLGVSENLARSMAASTALKIGASLNTREMDELIDQLFACGVPYSSPSGRKCFISLDLEDLKKRFTLK